jgi:hypothetical protein
MFAWNLQNWIIDRYVDGKLPLPGPVVQLLLNTGVEAYFRLSRGMYVLPDKWSGRHGPLAERSEDLMRIHYDKPAVPTASFIGWIL